MRRVFIGLAAVAALTVCAETTPPTDAKLNVSGDMTPNADGTASFEFRVANDRADVVVTGFTVTVAFYDRTVASNRKLAEYNWSFLNEVRPNDVLLEYGVLDAKAVADLKQRHTTADPLANADYTFEAKIDSQARAEPVRLKPQGEGSE